MAETSIITILGLIAGGLTTFSVFPEVYLAYKNMKKSKMQHTTLLLFLIGNILLLYTSIATILFSTLLLSKFIF